MKALKQELYNHECLWPKLCSLCLIQSDLHYGLEGRNLIPGQLEQIVIDASWYEGKDLTAGS